MGVTSTAAADHGGVDHLHDFRGVYRAHYGFVWHALHRFGTTPMLLPDAVQDVFVAAYRRRADYRGPSPKPWLYGIARRVASNYRRSMRRRLERDRALPRAARTDLPHASREAIETLDRFLAALAVDDRELFVLAKLEGMTGRELAEATGRNMQTLYTRLRKLERELQARLGDLERVRRERPGATAQSWALLVPALEGAALPTAGAAVATTAATSAWGWVAALGIAALGLALVDPLHDDPVDPARPIAVGSAGAAPADGRPTVPPTVAASTDPAPPRIASATPPGTESPAPAPARPRAAQGRAHASRADPSIEPPRAEGLAAETELLRRASTALQAGRADEALRTTAEHARRFPDSALADLRAAVRIEALCAAGKTAQARGEAGIFLRAHPGSPVAERIERACATPPEKSPDPDKTGT